MVPFFFASLASVNAQTIDYPNVGALYKDFKVSKENLKDIRANDPKSAASYAYWNYIVGFAYGMQTSGVICFERNMTLNQIYNIVGFELEISLMAAEKVMSEVKGAAEKNKVMNVFTNENPIKFVSRALREHFPCKK